MYGISLMLICSLFFSGVWMWREMKRLNRKEDGNGLKHKKRRWKKSEKRSVFVYLTVNALQQQLRCLWLEFFSSSSELFLNSHHVDVSMRRFFIFFFSRDFHWLNAFTSSSKTYQCVRFEQTNKMTGNNIFTVWGAVALWLRVWPWIERSGFEPWLTSLLCVLGQSTLGYRQIVAC